MTGLEKIIGIIRQDAIDEAKMITDRAEAEAGEVISAANAEAQKETELAIAKGQAKADDIIARAKSAAQLETRKTLLFSKQEIIGDTIDAAKNSLAELEDEKYFAILISLLKKHYSSGDGIMKLAQKDLAKLPADFEKKVKEIGRISISNDAAPINNGFLLIYGGIEINCSFDALFEDAAEELGFNRKNSFRLIYR